MNFLLKLNFFILSHPVTSRQPRKIVQIHMPHPVEAKKSVEIAIDSIEPTETKRAKVDTHKTMSEKKKTDLVSAFGFDCDNDEKDEYKPSPMTSRVLKI